MTKEDDPSKGLVGPLYRDLASPAAKEIGNTLGRAVRLAIAPARGVLWTFEAAEAWLTDAVSQRLQRRTQPQVEANPSVTVPALIALTTRGAEDSLRGLFANLVATALDPATAGHAHPSFVAIIQQLSSDEARLLSLLYSCGAQGKGPLEFESLTDMAARAGCAVTDSEFVRASLGNICRLGIAETTEEEFSEGKPLATPVKAIVIRMGQAATQDAPFTAMRINSLRLLLMPTTFGELFMGVCIGTEIG